MNTEEIARADDRQLLRRRLDLLQGQCPVCDQGKDWPECRCGEDFREVDAIETTLRARGVTW